MGVICAQCITGLHARYPVTAEHPHPENGTCMIVRDWPGAEEAHTWGLRIIDPVNGVTFGIYAVTFVGGTALCFSHAALAQSFADRVKRAENRVR